MKKCLICAWLLAGAAVGFSPVAFGASSCSNRNARAVKDTVNFRFNPTEPSVKMKVADQVTIVDGEVMLEGYNFMKELTPGSISCHKFFKDSLTCAQLGGRKGTEVGVNYIVTKANADKVKVPVAPKGAKPASYSVWANQSFPEPWSVEVAEKLDCAPSFGKGKPESFQSWLLSTVMDPSAKDYLPLPWNEGDYGWTRVSFVVSKDGKVSDVKVLEPRSDRFNKAVIDLISDSPAWTPATKHGKPVAVVVTYPVNCFILIQ